MHDCDAILQKPIVSIIGENKFLTDGKYVWEQ